MRINFRQGIVSHQTSGNVQDFLSKNPSGHVDLKADNRPVTITVAHANTNYTFTDNYTVTNAWMGPFSASTHYWLYWDFNPLTFQRTFGYTTLEPVAQDAVPGNGDVEVIDVIPGSTPGVGAFVVEGHFVLRENRQFAIIGSTDNDGTYTVKQATYSPLLGQTQIAVYEVVATPTDTTYGDATLDIDAYGIPLLTNGRHWYNTETNRHYVLNGNQWTEVLRVFAAHLRNASQFLPQTINTGSFIGTQIGDTTSVRTGRVVYDEASDVIRRDDGTFFTTEDQFFANAARVDAIRLESNVARAQFAGPGSAIDEFSVVAWEPDPTPAVGGRIRVADYDDAGTTVVGILTEPLGLNEVGAVMIQGVITNPDWNWTTGPSAVPVGTPLWIENGQLVPYDPHVQGNRAGPPIIGINNGSTNPYFVVAGGYTLEKGQVITVRGNSTNNDGSYRVVESVYNSSPATTTIYVEEIIIDAIVAGQMFLTVGNYPIGQVPVARVLDKDSIVFEQGLGGKGDRGPAGSIENLPIATTTDLGGIYLNLPPVDQDIPLVVGDNDPRLSDARPPLAHTHGASEINFTPGHGIASLNVQGALEELGNEKVNKAGDTMTGFLTLHANPINALHAVPKRYVDSLVSGLVWLNPICVVNMISDVVTMPPIINDLGDSYIIPPGAVGLWAAIPAGNIVTWDGAAWLDRGPLTGMNPAGARLAVAIQSSTTPSGSFAGHKNEIAQYTSTGVLDYFEVPTSNNAVYACNSSEIFAYNQYAFSGTEWILFGGAQALSADGATIVQNGNTLSVIQFGDGGIIDSRYWQGLEPSDLALLYSPITHTHSASNLSFSPYVSPVPGLGDITATSIQNAVQETYNEKASITPNYPTFGDLPDPSTYNGMIAQVTSENTHYVAQNGSWNKLATYPLTIPYDISFFLAGQMLFANAITGSFIATRQIHLPANLPGSIARAKIAPAVDVTYQIITDDGTSTTAVGQIDFVAGNRNGAITFPSNVDLVAGTAIEVVTPVTLEPTIQDVVITLAGCAPADSCTLPIVSTLSIEVYDDSISSFDIGVSLSTLINVTLGTPPYVSYFIEVVSAVNSGFGPPGGEEIEIDGTVLSVGDSITVTDPNVIVGSPFAVAANIDFTMRVTVTDSNSDTAFDEGVWTITGGS